MSLMSIVEAGKSGQMFSIGKHVFHYDNGRLSICRVEGCTFYDNYASYEEAYEYAGVMVDEYRAMHEDLLSL